MRAIGAPQSDSEARGGRGDVAGAGAPDVEQRPASAVDLGELYRRVEALTGHRPRLEARQVVQLRAAVRRCAAHVVARPAGTPAEPIEVLLAQIEHFAPRDERALAWALARLDGYSRQLEACARVSASDGARSAATGAGESLTSQNCAALFNQHLTSDVSDPLALACTTGAREPVDEMHDASAGATLGEGTGTAEQRTEGEGGPAEPFGTEALLERVAARERRLEAVSGRLRAQEAKTVTRARCWRSDSSLPLGLLAEAAQARAGGAFKASRPWLSERQVERLRRAERRYARYAGERPERSPAAPAAVLIDLVEHAPRAVCQPLPWAIAQLDLLSKRMRRERRRGDPAQLARRRAERRRERAARHAGAFYRRPPSSRIEIALEHLSDGLLGRRAAGETAAGWAGLERELQAASALPTQAELEAAKRREAMRSNPSTLENRGWRWQQVNSRPLRFEDLAQLSDRLCEVGAGVTAEQLRCELRDRLLLTGADQAVLEQLKRTEAALPYTPERYHPRAAQLTARELDRGHERACRCHRSPRAQMPTGERPRPPSHSARVYRSAESPMKQIPNICRRRIGGSSSNGWERDMGARHGSWPRWRFLAVLAYAALGKARQASATALEALDLAREYGAHDRLGVALRASRGS